jgi:hypothetical protein
MTPSPAPLPSEELAALLTAWESAVRHNAAIYGKDSVSAYHEDEDADEATPKAALDAYLARLVAAVRAGGEDTAIVDALERGLCVDDAHGNQTAFDAYWPGDDVEVFSAPTARDAAAKVLAAHPEEPV